MCACRERSGYGRRGGCGRCGGCGACAFERCLQPRALARRQLHERIERGEIVLLQRLFVDIDRAARVAGKNDFPACDPDTLILVDQEDVIRFNAFQRLLAARGGDDLDMIAGSPTHDYEAIDANARSHSSFVDPSFSALWRQLHSFKSVEQADAMISTEIHRLMTLRSDIYAYAGAGPGTRIDQAVLSAMGEGRAPEVAPVPPAPPTRANDDGPTP